MKDAGEGPPTRINFNAAMSLVKTPLVVKKEEEGVYIKPSFDNTVESLNELNQVLLSKPYFEWKDELILPSSLLTPPIKSPCILPIEKPRPSVSPDICHFHTSRKLSVPKNRNKPQHGKSPILPYPKSPPVYFTGNEFLDENSELVLAPSSCDIPKLSVIRCLRTRTINGFKHAETCDKNMVQMVSNTKTRRKWLQLVHPVIIVNALFPTTDSPK